MLNECCSCVARKKWKISKGLVNNFFPIYIKLEHLQLFFYFWEECKKQDDFTVIVSCSFWYMRQIACFNTLNLILSYQAQNFFANLDTIWEYDKASSFLFAHFPKIAGATVSVKHYHYLENVGSWCFDCS